MAFKEMIARLGLDNSNFLAGVNSTLGGLDKIGTRTSALTKDLAASTQKMGASITQMGQTMSSFGSSATMSISAPLAGLATLAVATSDKMATAKIGFETMLGSAQKADTFIRELADFAKRTPFDFPGLQAAAQRMLAMGFASKEIIPILTAVGNAVGNLGGGQDKIDRIVLAFGQMSAKGRVMAQEMNQLTEAGVKGWQYLADAIGKAQGRIVTVGEVMKMAEKGMIDGAAAVKVMAAAMERDFGGGMEKASKLITGQLSNLRDAIIGPNGPLEQLGKALTPMVMGWLESLKGLVPVVNSIIGQFTSLSPATQQFALQFAAIAVAIGPVTFGLSKLALTFGPLMTGIGGLLSALSGIPAAFAAFSKFPIGWITGTELALVSLTAAVVVLGATLAVAKLETWARSQSEAFGDFVVAMTGPISIIPKLGEKFRELKAELEDWSSFLPAIKQDLSNIVTGFLALDQAIGGPISSFKQSVAAIREMFPELEKLASLYRGVAAAKEVLDKLTTIPKAAPPPTALERTAIMGAAAGGAGAPGLTTAQMEAMAAAGKKLTDVARDNVFDELSKKLLRIGQSAKGAGGDLRETAAEMAAAAKEMEQRGNFLDRLMESGQAYQEFMRSAGAAVRDASGNIIEELNETEDEIREFNEAMRQASVEFNEWFSQSAQGYASWLTAARDAAGNLVVTTEMMDASMKELGVTMEKDLGAKAEKLAALFEQVSAAELAGEREYMDVVRIQIAMLEAKALTAQGINEIERKTLENARALIPEIGAQNKAVKEATGIWDVFGRQVSTIFTDLSRNMTDAILAGKGFADAFENMGKAIVEGFVRTVIEGALNAFVKYLKDEVGSAIKGVEAQLGGLGKILSGIFGTGGGSKAPGAPGGTPGVPGGAPTSAPAGGLLGAIDVISGVVSAVAAVWDVTIQRRIEKDIGRIEVTSRGQLAEALNLRADLWDQHGKLLSKLDGLLSFTWVKLDEIITSIRNWAGPAAGGPGPTGSTTPGIPNPFAGGAGQPLRTRTGEVPEHLPYPESDRPPAQVAIPGGGSLSTSNVPWGNPFPEPQQFEESLESLRIATDSVNQMAAAWIRIGDVLVRGMVPAVNIPAMAGGHDGGVGSTTAYYQNYFRQLEEAQFGPRQRGTQGSPFGGGQGGALPPGVVPVGGNVFNITIMGDLATEAQRRVVARELAQYVDEYRTTIRQR